MARLRLAALTAIAVALVLSGCATGGPPTTPGLAPAGSSSTTTTPDGDGSASPAPTPTAGALPDATGALDVGGYESAHFASPTGAIWCALNDAFALCHFPRGMKMSKVPSASKVCPKTGLDVTGVSVEVKAQYFCSGGAEALPMTNGMNVDWWKTTGFPSVKYDGFKLATLPYGEKLVHGRFVCASQKSGVTCVNTDNGTGFTVSKAGVKLHK